MKKSIDWHLECLKRCKLHGESRRRLAMEAVEDYQAIVRRNEFYERQIAEAIKRGMKEFDSERLLVKKKNAE